MKPTDEALFTRQIHKAKKAGDHFDYRIVIGDKAYSWASKKDVPEPGSAIIFHEQPVHTASYALSEKVEIPEGQYGAGTTTLDWVRKTKVNHNPEKNYYTLEAPGEKYLLKKLDPEKYGEKAWLFKNLSSGIEKKAILLELYQHDETGRKVWKEPGWTQQGWSTTGRKIHKGKKKDMSNKYLEKIAKYYIIKNPSEASKAYEETHDSKEIRPNLIRLKSKTGLLEDHYAMTQDAYINMQKEMDGDHIRKGMKLIGGTGALIGGALTAAATKRIGPAIIGTGIGGLAGAGVGNLLARAGNTQTRSGRLGQGTDRGEEYPGQWARNRFINNIRDKE